jgi:hypothetical protein
MWLPKDERVLLSYYYSQIGWAGICQRDPSELEKVLRERKDQAKGEVNEEYVMNVVKSLRKHGLITNHHKVRDSGQIEIELTQKAINLGKKYNSKIGTLGVWFTEYMWFWIILSVLISLIGVIVTICMA